MWGAGALRRRGDTRAFTRGGSAVCSPVHLARDDARMGLHGPKPRLTPLSGTSPVPPPAPDLPAEVARAYFVLAAPLSDAGLLAAVDTFALEAAARALVRWQEAEAVVDRDGLMVKGSRSMIPNPALRVARNARAEYLSWSSRLGLTPTDRVTLGIASPRPTLNASLTARIGDSPRAA